MHQPSLQENQILTQEKKIDKPSPQHNELVEFVHNVSPLKGGKLFECVHQTKEKR